MPTRPQIPPAGTPISPPGQPGALRETLAAIAAATPTQAAMQNGIEGSEGPAAVAPPQVSIALFQLTEDFNDHALPAGATWPTQPSSTWFHAQATRVEYYPGSGQQQWATPDQQGDDATTPETAYIWYPTSYQYSSGSSSGVGSVSGTNPGLGAGSRVWCLYDETAGVWVVLYPAPVWASGYVYDGQNLDGSASVHFSSLLANGITWDETGTRAKLSAAGKYLVTGHVAAGGYNSGYPTDATESAHGFCVGGHPLERQQRNGRQRRRRPLAPADHRRRHGRDMADQDAWRYRYDQGRRLRHAPRWHENPR